MIMTEKFKILGKFIKDLSSETPDVETYLFVRDRISNYQLNIDIKSKALKNKMIEVSTTFSFEDKENNKKKSHFEILHATVIKISDEVIEKKEMEKIILIEVPKIIYPEVRETLCYLFEKSGFKSVNLQTEIDFEKLYEKKNA